ncbi:MAG: BatA domain-containing protein [Planctomycetota bacterium]
MSFLSFAFLFALPLASAPILLHLFDRQRNVVIEWGAMQFLVEAARRRQNARRLQQWLLLLLRTLAIFCLVMALARPLVNSTWLGVVDRSDTILVVDNSLSMMRTVDGASVFQAAIRTAGEQLDRVPPGDTVRVLMTSPYPIWMTPASVRISGDARSSIREQLARQQPTQGRSDLLSAMFTAVQAELIPGTKHRHVVVLTDGQAADWSTGDEQVWRRLHEVLKKPVVPTDVNMITLGPKQTDAANLAVNQIHCSRTQVGQQQPVSLAAQIQNHGGTASAPCSVHWLIAGEEQSRSEIPALPPGAMHEVLWKHSFSTLGVFSISAEVTGDDVLLPDNHETLIVEVVDRIPVLVVESSPSAAEVLQDAFFVQAALGWVDGEPLPTQGVYVPSLVTPEQLERTALNEYRAIVIPNLSELSESVLRNLQSFVSDGGGLWVALGPRTDVERFNQFFFADSDGLAPLPIDRVVDELDSQQQKTTIDPFVATHPATASLADSARLDIGTIVVSRHFRFASSPSGESPSALLSLTNGEPLAVEKLVGRGRVIVQAVPLRLDWSDLARSQAFVVIVQDWLNYLTQPRATRHNLAPGDPISLHLPGSDVLEATLRTPQSEDIELTAEATSTGVAFRTSRTIQPGEYSLEVGLTGDKIPFHVHRDPRESNLTALSAAESQLITDISEPSKITSTSSSQGSAPSDPVWPLLLMLLVGLILAELMLAGNMSRRRFGTDPIAETTEHMAETQAGLAGTMPSNRRSMAEHRIELTKPRT